MDSSDSSSTAGDTPPKWLNATLMQKALRQDRDSQAVVKSVSVSRATAPGDNYASTIYRVTAALGDGGQRTLLVKVPPEGEAMVKAIVETGLFRTESIMLGKYFPAMKSLLDHAAPGRFPAFVARCPLHGSDPEAFVFLEDLKPHGFKVADRQRGLGLRHSLLAIRSLGRFHGASAALLAKEPDILNNLPNPFRCSNGTWDSFVTSVFEMTVEVCKKWPGFEMYVEILEKLKLNAMDIYTKMNDYTPGKFNVILHGDFWTNNMMFKYDENDYVEDYRMVDLQVSHVTSPAIDLLYFFYTSLSDDVIKHHQQLLLREYHTALTEILDLLGIPGPSFQELVEDIDEHGTYALFGAFGVWPITRAEKVPDLNAQLSGDSSKSTFMYETPKARKWLQGVLQDFKRKGWLEIPDSP